MLFRSDVQRIDRLITEIADASRIDAELSRATFEDVDLAALASQVVGARDVRASPTTPIRLHRKGGLTVVPGDAARLERVLENLLDNAVSFSPPGGEVALTVWGDGENAQIAVADEGPGVPMVEDRKSTRLNSSHIQKSRMPSSA